MANSQAIEQMVSEISNDLTSGAAELALRSINIFRAVLDEAGLELTETREELAKTARMLLKAHPAMAPIINLSSNLLFEADAAGSTEELQKRCDQALTAFEQQLCNNASRIADYVHDLIPFGTTVFAYSFSSTVISSLMAARSRKSFRVVCTEARPSMEGRKLSKVLADSGIEVVHTFDNAMGLILPSCRVAFMGADCLARPGLVNKIGSWLLALACRELNIRLYALAGTEKFVPDEILFSFEDHERPGKEVWEGAPAGVTVVNRQFDLIPFSWLSGLVTEKGILFEKEIEKHIEESSIRMHPALEAAASVH